MHGANSDMLALLWLLLGSFAMPVLSSRVNIPSAVLLIGYGLLVGPAALGVVRETSTVGFLYEMGFVVLMFLAGMEIDFNGIRQRGRQALLVVLLICLAIFGLAFLTAFLLGMKPLFGLALGATSVGLPLAVLKETGKLRSPSGRAILLLGSVGEFLTVVGITLFYFASRYGLGMQLVVGLAKLVSVLAVAGLTLRTLVALAWWHPRSFSKLVETRHGSEIGVRATLLLMVAFSALAVLADVESILGAFLAGALIAFVLRGKEVLEEKLTVVGHGLFVPIFFIVVGMRFDISVVTWDNLVRALELLLAAFAVRLLPCLAMLRLGLGLRDMLGTALLLSAPLTLLVAIAALGLELGQVSLQGQGTLIVLAVLSGVVFPVVYRIVGGQAQSEPEAVDQGSR